MQLSIIVNLNGYPTYFTWESQAKSTHLSDITHITHERIGNAPEGCPTVMNGATTNTLHLTWGCELGKAGKCELLNLASRMAGSQITTCVALHGVGINDSVIEQ